MWSSRLRQAALRCAERPQAAPVEPADPLFSQVGGVSWPVWQSRGQGFESPQLHPSHQAIPSRPQLEGPHLGPLRDRGARKNAVSESPAALIEDRSRCRYRPIPTHSISQYGGCNLASTRPGGQPDPVAADVLSASGHHVADLDDERDRTGSFALGSFVHEAARRRRSLAEPSVAVGRQLMSANSAAGHLSDPGARAGGEDGDVAPRRDSGSRIA
jgi:hypothetical protein